MTQNGEAIPQDHRLLRRNAARTAIVEAGRRLAARDGVAELSLSAVAAEAGFGPSTVFGHFRNKDELLIAIVAEDLAALAALMRGDTSVTGPFVQPDYLGTASHDPYAQPVLEPANEAVGLEASPSEVLDLTPVDALTEDMGVGAAVDFAGNEATASTHDDADSRPRVDPWLERRLRVFEHALTDVEHRLKEAEASATKSLSLSEHGMTSLFERMEAFERQQSDAAQALTQRMEETERRQRGTTSEMRAAMNDTATRIEILESKLRSDQERGAFGKRMMETRESSPSTPAYESPELPADNSEDHNTYAAAAERATSAAAALAEMQEEPPTDSSAWQSFAARRVRVGRKHVLMFASFTAIVFLLAGFVSFYAGHARGRDTAVAAQLASLKTAKPVHRVARTASRGVSAAATTDPRTRLVMLAQAGNAKAQIVLGLQYLHGEGVAPDRRVAADWIRRAAAQQDPLAQYWLGTLFEHGDGMAAGSAEAVRWYEAAAGQGNRKAMHALGVAYAQGLGTQRDYSKAARWFTSAADMGLVNSQFNLGVLYERGLGVPQNLLDAYKWYSIAAAQGDSESRARVEVLKTQLNADDLFASERAAASFRPQNIDAPANNLPTMADLTGSAMRR